MKALDEKLNARIKYFDEQICTAASKLELVSEEMEKVKEYLAPTKIMVAAAPIANFEEVRYEMRK